MPAKLHVDYEEIRAKHVKGISLSDLARDYDISYSTLKSRASRENWAAIVASANSAVIQSATRDLTQSANHWITRIDKLIHASLGTVETEVAKGNALKLRDLQVALDCAERANRIARANYGLDNEGRAGAQTLVQVHVNTGRKHDFNVDEHEQVVDVEQTS